MAVRKVDALKTAYQTDWERLQPYLKAFVGGKHADEKFTDEDDARYRRSRNLLWGWSAAITIVVCVFTQAVGIFAIAAYAFVSFIGPMIGVATMHAVNELFGNGVNTAALEKMAQFLGAALMLAAVPWFITKSAFGYGRMKRVRARQYYLRNFKALHAKRGAAFNWSAAFFWLWPAYRGLLAWTGALFVLVLALLWVDGHMHIGTLPAWYRGARIALIVGLFIAIGMTATRIYFRHAMQAVAAVLELPPEAALKKLQQRGGTSAWPLALAVIALLCAANVVIDTRIAVTQEVQTKKAVASQITPANSQERDETNARLSRILQMLEKSGKAPRLRERHPEFYVGDLQYDYRLAVELLMRNDKNTHESMTPEEAMLAAIREIETTRGSAGGK